MVDSRSDNLWAITCYFNPVGYRRRLENYRIFRQRLKAPLVTVELSFGEEFHLSSQDADILLQLRSPSILWQKERLLNMALKSLPGHCNKVAWLDCDILFESDHWVERASRALDEFALLHLFEERNELPKDFIVDKPWTSTLTSQSVLYYLAKGELAAEEIAMPGLINRRATSGLAWAGRRQLLEEYGLYDACIVGSGNIAVLSAALGVTEHFVRAIEMNPRRAQHYLAWAKPYFKSIQGRVSCIPERVFHLWHGDLDDRRHLARHRPFAQFDFDPYSDIAIDQNGCWRWSSDKTEMHSFVRQYFESRKEDGI